MKMNKRFKAIQFQMITQKIINKINLHNKKIDYKETADKQVEDKEIKTNKSKSRKMKKILIAIGSTIGVIGGIYIGGVLFFTNHFYWGTSINGIQVGGENIYRAQTKLEAVSSAYSLELKERNEKTEILQGSDMGLTYTLGDKLEKLKESQNVWAWPLKCFKTDDLKVKNEISYDKELLKDRVNQLECLIDENIRKPEDASVKYIDGLYRVVEGDKGNTVNPITLYQTIVKAINNEEEVIDLEENHCYEEPIYSKDSPKLNALKNELNHYLNAKITYDFGDRQEVVDKSLLSAWLDIDKNMQVVLDEKAVTEYVISLAEKYDTLGKEREFIATTGSKVKVMGGDYGWKINVQDEIGELLKLIRQGSIVVRTPFYTQTALHQGRSDIGQTYVEVNLSKQHLWFYKEGQLVVEGDIVTGNLKRDYDTPQGTYTLDYKKANAILRGPGYASPVKYWMPFNGGIGLHDASWRSSFGGEIYRSNGSHGCVNLPIQVASNIFNNIEAGVPVVCYFDEK